MENFLYALELMNEPRFREDRLVEMMARRNLNAGQLAYLSGVSQPMIHYLQHGERQNVSGVNIAKLAGALGCSVEYLLGLTDDPIPQELELSNALWELINVARTLPESRQHDLRLIAETYRRAAQEGTLDADQLMADVLEQVEAEGGKEALNVLLAVLERLLPGRQFGSLLRGTSEESH